MKKHYPEVDCLRGIAITLVLLGHSIISFPIDLNQIGWCGVLHEAVSSVHLPLFFAVAGFCFRFRGYGDLLRKKTPRLLIPYLVFSVVGILAPLLLPQLVNEPKPLEEMLLGLFTGECAWFLYTLFLLFLLFPLLLKIAVFRGGKLVVAVLLLGIYFFPWWPAVCNLANLAKYLPFFALGYAIRENLDDLGERLDRAERKLGRIGLMALCVPIWAGMVALIILIGEDRTFFLKFPALPAALAGMLVCVELVRWHVDSGICKAFIEIGNYSLPLYLFNGYFLTVSRTVMIKVLGITAPVLIILGNFAAILGLNYLFARFVIARVKLFRTLTGMV